MQTMEPAAVQYAQRQTLIRLYSDVIGQVFHPPKCGTTPFLRAEHEPAPLELPRRLGEAITTTSRRVLELDAELYGVEDRQ